MKYRFNEARGVQARGCLIEIEEVLKKWNYRIVPSVHPFITRGYQEGIKDMSEGYEDDPTKNS